MGGGFAGFRERIRVCFYEWVKPLERLLVASKLNPNVISFTGVLFSGLCGFFFSGGLFFRGAIFLFLAGMCDALDGTIAREQGKASKKGSFLDSTLDRLGEILIFVGLVYYFSGRAQPWFVAAIVIGLSCSMMVSYVRAKSEALGLSCKVGLFQRPERFVMLILGSLLSLIPKIGLYLFQVILIIISLLAVYTTIERMRYVLRVIETGGVE